MTFTIWPFSREKLLTPDLPVVLILGQRFFEDFTTLPRKDTGFSHKYVGKSKVVSFFSRTFKSEPVQEQLHDFLIV